MAEVFEKAQEPAQANVTDDSAAESTRPTSRATIDRKKTPQRPQRKFLTGAKVWMRRSATDVFEFDMIVTDCKFDEERNGWNYWLKEDNTQALAWPTRVPETDLKKRR